MVSHLLNKSHVANSQNIIRCARADVHGVCRHCRPTKIGISQGVGGVILFAKYIISAARRVTHICNASSYNNLLIKKWHAQLELKIHDPIKSEGKGHIYYPQQSNYDDENRAAF